MLLNMMKRFLFLLSTLLVPAFASAKPIKVGVPLALTGELAGLGQDMRNALVLGKEILGFDEIEYVFEDDACQGKTGVSVAQKLLSIDKVQAILGVSCNTSFLPSAPLYRRADLPVLSTSATTGDVKGVGPKIYRLFPSDEGASSELFKYLKGAVKSVAILTEQDAYTTLLQRNFIRLNEEAGRPLSIVTQEVEVGARDLKGAILAILRPKPEAIFINTTGEPGFIMFVKEVRKLGATAPIYTGFFPASEATRAALGALAEGMKFSNLPSFESRYSDLGRKFMREYESRFGPPNAWGTVVSITFEGLRLLQRAHKKGVPLDELLKAGDFGESTIGSYTFDADGAIQGISFEMQEIKGGKVAPLQ